jgi:uncharacterized damage-inducible protein DinB
MTGEERMMLSVWLDYQRATLLWKCERLSGGDLARKGIPTSNLSLLGLMRHMTLVEWHWFERVFSGDPSPQPFSTDADPDSDFNDLQPERAGEDLERFLHQCDVSRAIVVAADSLDQEAAEAKDAVSLRWIMVHMIEEYARHNGHADLLRELIDGEVGE